MLEGYRGVCSDLVCPEGGSIVRSFTEFPYGMMQMRVGGTHCLNAWVYGENCFVVWSNSASCVCSARFPFRLNGWGGRSSIGYVEPTSSK